MQFVEAFQKLGYRVEAPRSDWSAEKDDGICITLWNTELRTQNGMPYQDLWELHPDAGDWTGKSGHIKRTRHLSRAMAEFDGKVDVIFLSGDPGGTYQSANPWMPETRGHNWKVTRFDEASGYFRAEVDTSEVLR